METIFENEIDEALLSASSSYSKSVSSSHSQEADEDEINNAFFEDRKFISMLNLLKLSLYKNAIINLF